MDGPCRIFSSRSTEVQGRSDDHPCVVRGSRSGRASMPVHWALLRTSVAFPLSRALQIRSTHLRSPPESRTPKAAIRPIGTKGCPHPLAREPQPGTREALTEERDQARQEEGGERPARRNAVEPDSTRAKRRAWHAKLQSDGRMMLLGTESASARACSRRGSYFGASSRFRHSRPNPRRPRGSSARPTHGVPVGGYVRGEDPVPIPPYVIVSSLRRTTRIWVAASTASSSSNRQYALVDLSEENRWIRIVWIPSAFEPDPSIPYLQL